MPLLWLFGATLISLHPQSCTAQIRAAIDACKGRSPAAGCTYVDDRQSGRRIHGRCYTVVAGPGRTSEANTQSGGSNNEKDLLSCLDDGSIQTVWEEKEAEEESPSGNATNTNRGIEMAEWVADGGWRGIVGMTVGLFLCLVCGWYVVCRGSSGKRWGDSNVAMRMPFMANKVGQMADRLLSLNQTVGRKQRLQRIKKSRKDPAAHPNNKSDDPNAAPPESYGKSATSAVIATGEYDIEAEFRAAVEAGELDALTVNDDTGNRDPKSSMATRLKQPGVPNNPAIMGSKAQSREASRGSALSGTDYLFNTDDSLERLNAALDGATEPSAAEVAKPKISKWDKLDRDLDTAVQDLSETGAFGNSANKSEKWNRMEADLDEALMDTDEGLPRAASPSKKAKWGKMEADLTSSIKDLDEGGISHLQNGHASTQAKKWEDDLDESLDRLDQNIISRAMRLGEAP